MFQAGTDAALDDQVRRAGPQPVQKPPFRIADLAKAPFQGIGAGIAGSEAFGAEILGAFGQVAGAYPEAIGAIDLTPKQRAEADKARDKVLTKGLDYSNEVGDALRTRAKDIMPDPQSTHVSAQVVAGLTEFATKAVGYGVTAGPVVGAAITAGDVGMAEADRLKQMGVDELTRAKAGAAQGVLAGGSLIFPMTGATAATRFAKGAFAGELGTVGTALAEKKILEAAGYQKQADTFDPLDPVSLALGVVPGVLGAKFGRPKPLRSEADMRAAAVLTPAEQARSDAFERSTANLAELEAAIKAQKDPEARAVLEAELSKQRTAAAGHVAERALATMPDLEPAVRVRASADAIEASRLTPPDDILGTDAHLSAVELAADQIGRGERVTVGDVAGVPIEAGERLVRTADAMGEVRELTRERATEAPVIQRAEPFKPVELPEVIAARAAAADMRASGKTVGEFLAATKLPDAERNLVIGLSERGGKKAEAMLGDFGRTREANPERAAHDVAADVVDAARTGREVTPVEKTEAKSPVSRAADEISTLTPELQVRMDDGTGGKVGELLASVRQAAADEALHAKLIEVAAACALRH